jgi:uncharacterized protein
MVTPNSRLCRASLLAAVLLVNQGCEQQVADLRRATISNSSFHEKFGWKAEDFFDDPKVIALCRAIEADDLHEIQRIIQSGADVNLRGKGNMTPLMWAYPDNKFERFKIMLDHGADPNVKITTNLGVPSGFKVGDSVVTCSAASRFSGHFQAMMNAGGDPNIRDGLGATVLHVIIDGAATDKIERCKLAIEAGADLNALFMGGTPAISAVSNYRYDVAKYLLEQGADANAYMSNELQKLIHVMILREKDLEDLTPEHAVEYRKLLDWLVAHGQDPEKARQDVERWKKFPRDPKKYAAMRNAEREARKKKEAAEANARVGDEHSEEKNDAPISSSEAESKPSQLPNEISPES